MARTHNFRDIKELVADCGTKEISSHLLTALKNAKYLSPLYVSKYIETMSNYMKQLLLENMGSNLYSFYTNETSDVTSIEQLPIYTTFLRNQSISKHFIGLIPISKEVGAYLSAVNIILALANFFLKNDINLQQAYFVCMDTANVNSGKKNGLKRHLEYKVRLLKWIVCNSLKLGLTFKHLKPSFQCIAEIDIFLLNLRKYFKYCPLAMNIVGNTSEMYGGSPTVQICPSVTRWQAHERACETFHLHFENFLDALSTSYAKQKEAEALGMFIQSSSCQIIATNLMLFDVCKSIKLLILFFQTSKGACSVSHGNTYYDLCLQRLSKLKEKPNYCNSENFNRLTQTADDKTLTMPPSAQARSLEFDFNLLIMYSQNLLMHF